MQRTGIRRARNQAWHGRRRTQESQKEANEARRQAMRNLLYRKDS